MRAPQGDRSNYTNPAVEPLGHGIGRSRVGPLTKIRELVDGNGLPPITVVTPDQASHPPMLLPMLEHLRIARPIGRPRTRPNAVWGDEASSSRAIRVHLRGLGIKTMIPQPRDQQGHRKQRGLCSGKPVGLDTDDYKSRNVIERHSCRTTEQWRGLATRYDKHAIFYRTKVLMYTTITWLRQFSDTF